MSPGPLAIILALTGRVGIVAQPGHAAGVQLVSRICCSVVLLHWPGSLSRAGIVTDGGHQIG